MSHLQVSVPVSLTRISLQVDEIGAQVCPSCSTLMELHQPDAGFPDRMLWTCAHCAMWFLMELDLIKSEAILVSLPDHGHFRSALPDL